MQPWARAGGGLRVRAAERMAVVRRLFVVMVFRRGWVGGGGREAGFSTSLRSGRNDDFVCWVVGMVEGVMS